MELIALINLLKAIKEFIFLIGGNLTGAWLERVPRVPRHPQSFEIYHLAPAKFLRFST